MRASAITDRANLFLPLLRRIFHPPSRGPRARLPPRPLLPATTATAVGALFSVERSAVSSPFNDDETAMPGRCVPLSPRRRRSLARTRARKIKLERTALLSTSSTASAGPLCVFRGGRGEEKKCEKREREGGEGEARKRRSRLNQVFVLMKSISSRPFSSPTKY